MGTQQIEMLFNNFISLKNQYKIGHVTTDNMPISSTQLSVDGKEYINMAFSDYLCLSQEKRVKQGAINAIEKYGANNAISRIYVNTHIAKEAEEYMEKIFKKPCLIVSKTMMAHFAALPVIVDPTDLVVLDHQVHTTAKSASELLRANRINVETIRHNNMSQLEDIIIKNKEKYKKIWYLADGIYSIYGDTCPSNDIKELLEKYDQLYLYIDDAHGMSWAGDRGMGYVLSTMEFHPRMFLITSLGKGFGTGGGLIVCPNVEIKQRIEYCSMPLIFTILPQPSMFGAIVESAKIHLSDEIYRLQEKLKEKIYLFSFEAHKHKLPIYQNTESPIFFVPTGKAEMCCELTSYLYHDRGILVNSAIYPSVPLNCSGIRILLNTDISNETIISLIKSLSEEYYKSLNSRKSTLDDVLKYYKNLKSGNLIQ